MTDTAGRPTSIADAGPGPVPGLTPAEQRCFAAMKTLDAAAQAVETHGFPKAGTEYDAKLKAWRDAYADWRKTMRAVAKGKTA